MESINKFVRLWTTLNIFLLFIFAVSGCVSISAFVPLVGVPVGIASFAVGIKICAITAVIKKYKLIIKKKRKKHDKIALLGKANLENIEVLISKTLIDLYSSHDEFVSVNNVLRENIIRWKKKSKILRLLWNTLYKYVWYKQKNMKKWCWNNSR